MVTNSNLDKIDLSAFDLIGLKFIVLEKRMNWWTLFLVPYKHAQFTQTKI